MAFLHGLTSADMEVKVFSRDFFPASLPKKEWERGVVKYIQEEVMLDRLSFRKARMEHS